VLHTSTPSIALLAAFAGHAELVKGSTEVGMLLCLRIKISVSKNDIANLKPKNMSSTLQYASSHAANYVTVKRVIVDTGVIVDAKRQKRTKCAFRIWQQQNMKCIQA